MKKTLTLGSLALLVMGALLWLANDLPRQIVQGILAKQLGARAHLGELDIVTSHQIRLVDLRIDQVQAYPFVDELRFAEVWLEGPLREIAKSRFRQVRIVGMQIDLTPAPALEVPERPLPIIDELVIEPTILQITPADRSEAAAQLSLEATIYDVGTRAYGTLNAVSPSLLVGPLLMLASPTGAVPIVGQLEDLQLDLQFDHATSRVDMSTSRTTLARKSTTTDRGPTGQNVALAEFSELRFNVTSEATIITAELAATELSLTLAGEVATIEHPRVGGSLTQAPDGLFHFEAIPQIAGLRSGRINADWDPASQRLTDLGAEIDGLDLTRWLPGSGLDGDLDARLQKVDDQATVRVTVSPRRWQLTPERSLLFDDGAILQIDSRLAFQPIAALQVPELAGPIEARLDLPAGSGQWDAWTIPEPAFPLTAKVRGTWQLGNPGEFDPSNQDGRFEGEVNLDSRGLGQLSSQGDLWMDEGKTTADLDWRWKTPHLAKAITTLTLAGLPALAFDLTGKADVRGKLSGSLPNPTLRGQLRLEGLTAKATDWQLTESSASTAWSWQSRQSTFRLSDLNATGSIRAGELAPIPWRLEATGWSQVDASRGELHSATVSSPGLGTARANIAWQTSALGTTQAAGGLTFSDADLTQWRAIMPPVVTSQLPTEFEIQGMLQGELQGQLAEDSTWQIEGPLELASAGFSDSGGGRVLLDLAGRWQVRVDGGTTAPINLDARGSLGGFQLLWGTFYGDFSQIETNLDVRAMLPSLAHPEPAPWHLEAIAALPGGPTLQATLDSPTEELGLRYTLTLEDSDLETTHAQYLSPLLAEQIGQLTLGGALSVQSRGSYHGTDGPFAWSLAGDLELTNFELGSGGGQAAVTGLRLSLPFDMRRRLTTTPDFSGPRLSGHLAFDQLAVRGLELPPTDTDLIIEADSVGLEQALSLDILGGLVALEQLTLKDLLRPERHLETGLLLSEISLERLSSAMGIFPLEGALDGHFQTARLSPDRLFVDGGGQISMFGGTVDLHDISGEDILSRFPKLKLSADFENIDLGRLTRRIDFGEMTGVLRGSLRNCELFRGVPVRFSGKLETVDLPGVRRTIDVKAINNLTILSTGQGTNVFDRGLQKFFKRYTYERLAVSLRLADDVLLLRGEQRGDKELFLSGRLPFRIDVVNAQPGKTVSFQSMMGRLRSLDFSSATSKP